jgi:hypothetical protein
MQAVTLSGQELTMIRNTYVKFNALSIQGHIPVPKPGEAENQEFPYFLISTNICKKKKKRQQFDKNKVSL